MFLERLAVAIENNLDGICEKVNFYSIGEKQFVYKFIALYKHLNHLFFLKTIH